MAIKKVLATTLLTTIMSLSGCKNYEKYLTGEVTKEAGNVAGVVESSSALFGNESVKFGNPTYLIQVKTNDGVYTIHVENDYFREKTIESLSLAIENGTIVRFLCVSEGGHKYFDTDRIGTLKTNDITLLDVEKQ